jgi:pimeloyl-ACP methyl ester carboxylesterase
MKPCRPALLLAAVLGSALGAQAAPPAPAPALVFEPYTVQTEDGRPVAAELGWLAVPERRARPGGEPVRLAVLRLRSTAPSPGPPIVYLSGGPGGAGTAAVRGSRLPLLLALREAADVIALDQRGTGMSRPSLACRESWVYPLDRPADRESMLAVAREKSRACAAQLRRDGIDLAAYNTGESADDLEDLRRALGVPKIALLGTSYGTQLALVAARRHEGSLDRLVLAGVEAPHQGLHLPEVLDRRLAALDLVPALRPLLEKLGRRPVAVEVAQPLAGRSVRVVAGRFDLEAMVAQELSSRAGIAALPAKLRAMAGGDFGDLGRFALGLRRGWLGSAMPYAVVCSAGVPAERWERIRAQAPQTLLGRALDFPFPDICDAWGVPDLGPAYRAPVRTRLSALLLSGSLDVRTPPENAAEVLAGLSGGVHVIVEGAGHGDDLLLSSPEIARTIVDFFRGRRPDKERIEPFRSSASAAGRERAMPTPKIGNPGP